MNKTTLKPGETCFVRSYVANFDADLADRTPRHLKHPAWENFHAKFVTDAGYEKSMILDVSDSPELTEAQKRATRTGRISVSRKNIAEVSISNVRKVESFSAVQTDQKRRQAIVNQNYTARKAVADAAMKLFEQGYSISAAAVKIHSTNQRVSRAVRALGHDVPTRYRVRMIYKQTGKIEYFANRKDAAKRFEIPKAVLYSAATHIESKAGLLEKGDWMEWRGKIHETAN